MGVNRIILAALWILSVLAAALMFSAGPVRSESSPAFAMINPGPSSMPSLWSASSNVHGLGTTDMTFFSIETSVGSTFFVNLTVSNVEGLWCWGVGVVYDKTMLQYMRAWKPIDHVLAPMTPLIPEDPYNTPPEIDSINMTHALIKWGYGFAPPDEPWSFNGSGTLGQIQFKIIQEVNASYPIAKSYLSFDPAWTAVYYFPSGAQIPELPTSTVVYSSTSPIHSIGDVNDNGRIGMEDIIIEVAAFGSYSREGHTHPRYNANADLDNNGIIDMTDMIVIMMHFGQSI
jgi:hypothetical protein